MAKKVNLLLETLQWLEQLDYSSTDTGLILEDPSMHLDHISSLHDSDETFLRETVDIDLDGMRRCLRKWIRWTDQRKVVIVTHNERKPFVISKGMQLARLPAWRSFLLVQKGLRQWQQYTQNKREQRKNFLIRKPKKVSMRYRQKMMLKYWILRTRYRRAQRKFCFKLWKQKIKSHMPVKQMYKSLIKLWMHTVFLVWKRRSRWPRVAVQRVQFMQQQSLLRWRQRCVQRRGTRRTLRVQLREIIHHVFSLWRMNSRLSAELSRVTRVAVAYGNSRRCHESVTNWQQRARQLRQQDTANQLARGCFRRSQLQRSWSRLWQQAQRQRRFQYVLYKNLRKQKWQAYCLWRNFLHLSKSHLMKTTIRFQHRRGFLALVNGLVGQRYQRHAERRACRHFLHRFLFNWRFRVYCVKYAVSKHEMAYRRASWFHAQRRVRLGLRQWNQYALVKRQQTSLVRFARFDRTFRRWRQWHSLRLVHQSLPLQRAEIRFVVYHSSKALQHWRIVMRRQADHCRRYQVFRRLHSMPKCSPVRSVFEAWRDEYLLYAAYEREQVRSLIAKVTKTRLGMFWMKWRSVLERNRRNRHSQHRGWRHWRQYYTYRLRFKRRLMAMIQTQHNLASEANVAEPCALWAQSLLDVLNHRHRHGRSITTKTAAVPVANSTSNTKHAPSIDKAATMSTQNIDDRIKELERRCRHDNISGAYVYEKLPNTRLNCANTATTVSPIMSIFLQRRMLRQWHQLFLRRQRHWYFIRRHYMQTIVPKTAQYAHALTALASKHAVYTLQRSLHNWQGHMRQQQLLVRKLQLHKYGQKVLRQWRALYRFQKMQRLLRIPPHPQRNYSQTNSGPRVIINRSSLSLSSEQNGSRINNSHQRDLTSSSIHLSQFSNRSQSARFNLIPKPSSISPNAKLQIGRVTNSREINNENRHLPMSATDHQSSQTSISALLHSQIDGDDSHQRIRARIKSKDSATNSVTCIDSRRPNHLNALYNPFGDSSDRSNDSKTNISGERDTPHTSANVQLHQSLSQHQPQHTFHASTSALQLSSSLHQHLVSLSLPSTSKTHLHQQSQEPIETSEERSLRLRQHRLMHLSTSAITTHLESVAPSVTSWNHVESWGPDAEAANLPSDPETDATNIRRLLIRGSAALVFGPSSPQNKNDTSGGTDWEEEDDDKEDDNRSAEDDSLSPPSPPPLATQPPHCNYGYSRARMQDTKRMCREGERGYLQQFDHAVELARAFQKSSSSLKTARHKTTPTQTYRAKKVV